MLLLAVELPVDGEVTLTAGAILSAAWASAAKVAATAHARVSMTARERREEFNFMDLGWVQDDAANGRPDGHGQEWAQPIEAA